MDIKLFLLVLISLGAVYAQDSSEEEPSPASSSEEELATTPEPELNVDIVAKNFFINKVHQMASEVSKSLVISDYKVVWSPLVTVNAIVALQSNKTEENLKLRNGFESAWTYLNAENPLNTTLISTGYTSNELFLNETFKTLSLKKFPGDKDVDTLLQEAFLNITNFPARPENSTEDGLKFNETSETVLLTGLGLEALWLTPFHPRYAKKSKFYLNSTHVVKTKMMNNIGFYKYFDLEEFNAEAVAVPMRSPSVYAIFIKPKNPDHLEELNSKIENYENFTEIFNKFRTKRVQLSIPRLNIDSQFIIPLAPNVSSLHISSAKISYTGIYNSFHSPLAGFRPIKFTRLRRRKDDVNFKLNTPFIFHVYDNSISGLLLSGLVLNPVEHEPPMENVPPLMLDSNIKIAKEQSNDNCLSGFDGTRKSVGIYEDIINVCNTTGNANYSEIVQNKENIFNFLTMKKSEKKFWRDEAFYRNTTFFEVIAKVKYLSYGPFDAKIVQLKNISGHSIYILIPNERSGLSQIEEGLTLVPFSTIVCQMRDINLRLRLPETNVTQEEAKLTLHGIKMKDKKHKNNAADLVPIERFMEIPLPEPESHREARKKNRKYRKMNVDRPFLFIVTEEALTGGGFVAIGRVVGGGGKGEFVEGLPAPPKV